jgi:hypothetical protein
MAKRRKVAGHPNFEKGNPGGPGRPPILPELKAARVLTTAIVHQAFAEMATATPAEVKAKATDPNVSMLTATIGAILAKAYTQGDPTRLNFVLERTIGKVKEHIEVSNPYSNKSVEELEALIAEQKKQDADK